MGTVGSHQHVSDDRIAAIPAPPGRPSSVLARSGLSFSDPVVSGLVALSDISLLLVSGFLIYVHYVGGLESHPFYLWVFVMSSIAMLTSFHFAGLYELESLSRLRVQFKRIVAICGIIFLAFLALAFALKVSGRFSRVWAFSWFLCAITLICLARAGFYLVIERWGRTGVLTRNAVVLGGGEHGSRLIELLGKHNHPWNHILGVFEDRSSRVPPTVGGYPVLGTVDELLEYVQRQRVDDVLVALPWAAERRVLDIIKKLEVLPVNIRLCPDLLGMNFLRRGYDHYGGIPVLNLFDKPLAGWGYVAKSVEDRILATLGLVLTLPVMVAIAICIKCDSPGPILFRQKRYGFNNKLIEVWKFRTMYVDQQDDNANRLTTCDDPRVTRVGAFLRKTSLDELPQLFNVLRGAMSIVGPRPHAVGAKAAGKLYCEQVAQYTARHKVKPGITGWAQVNGWRGETDTEEKIRKRVEYDQYYIENWSIQFDLLIILRTVWVILTRENAY